MVIAKTELFDEALQIRASLFKALAHPVRLQILQFINETKTCISGDTCQHKLTRLLFATDLFSTTFDKKTN